MSTISTEISYKHYTVGFNGETTFIYNFLVLDAAHWEVLVNGQLRTDYTVTGVGNPDGGTLVFLPSAQLVAGNALFFRRQTPATQLLDLVDHAQFLADSLETAFNKLTLLVQDLYEELERRPALQVPVMAVLRNLVFPTPVPLKLWGWDALGQNIIYYDPAIVQVTPGLTAHLAFAETELAIPTVAAAVQLTSGTIFPAGCIRVGALVRVTTTFGNSLGLSTFSAGSVDHLECWGSGLARTTTAAPVAANNPGMFNNYELRPIPSNEAVVLTADAGTFDGTGAARVTAVYLMLTAT